MGFMKPKAPSGPSTAELLAQQEAAANAEKQRLEADRAEQEAKDQEDAQAALKNRESKRQAFATGIAAEDDEDRKRYLGGK